MSDKNIFAGSGPHKPDIPRSNFDWSHRNNGTFRFGRIYPVDIRECPPGTTLDINPHFAFDFMPLQFPIQTNVRAHLSYYKAPFRILAKDMDKWLAKDGSDTMPFISRSNDWCKTGSLADYMGIPTTKIDLASDSLTSDNLILGRPLHQSQLYRRPSTIPFSSILLYNGNEDFHDDRSGIAYHFPHQITSNTNASGTWSSGSYYTIQIPFYTADEIDTTDLVSSDKLYIRIWTETKSSISKFLPLAKKRYLPVNKKQASCSQGTSSSTTLSYYFLSENVNIEETVNGQTRYKSILYINLISDSGLPYSYEEFIDRECVLEISWDDSSTLAEWFAPSVDRVDSFASRIANGKLRGSTNPFKNTELTGTTDAEYKSSFETTLLNLGLSDSAVADSILVVSDNVPASPFVIQAGETAPAIPINALPFRMYEFIYNFFIRNQNIDPFVLNGEVQRNRFLTNDSMGADSTTPVDFKLCNYEVDYFTSCLTSPQFGNAPLVGITTNDATNEAILHMVDGDGSINIEHTNSGSSTFDVHQISERFTEPSATQTAAGLHKFDIAVTLEQGTGKVTGISNYVDVANKTSVLRLKDAIEFGISINDLRNANALQEWLERYQRAGSGRYQDIVAEFYGTTPPIGSNYPEYIGGITQDIMVDKITNTAASEEANLGDFAGSAHMVGHGDKIHCYCAEQSYIMGLLWFSVVPTYSQLLPRHFMKCDQLEYYNPVFRNIGLQPIYKKELCPLQLESGHEEDVFGYNRPYAEYVSAQDEVHGEFRTSLANYVLQRSFGTAPDLGGDFLKVKPEDLTDVFVYTGDDDKIFGQIYIDCKAQLQIPRFHTPTL